MTDEKLPELDVYRRKLEEEIRRSFAKTKMPEAIVRRAGAFFAEARVSAATSRPSNLTEAQRTLLRLGRLAERHHRAWESAVRGTPESRRAATEGRAAIAAYRYAVSVFFRRAPRWPHVRRDGAAPN
jgi:hypothetical protein